MDMFPYAMAACPLFSCPSLCFFTHSVPFHSLSLLPFCSPLLSLWAGGRTQGLVHRKWVLCHWATPPVSALCFKFPWGILFFGCYHWACWHKGGWKAQPGRGRQTDRHVARIQQRSMAQGFKWEVMLGCPLLLRRASGVVIFQGSDACELLVKVQQQVLRGTRAIQAEAFRRGSISIL